MSEDQVRIQYTGDVADLYGKIQTLEKANAKLETSVKNLVATGKKGGKDFDQAYAQAEARLKQLNQEIARMEFHMRRGDVAAGTARQSLGRMRAEAQMLEYQLGRTGRMGEQSFSAGLGVLRSFGAALGVGGPIFLGVQAMRGAWSLWQEDINKASQSIKEFQDAFIDAQFLNENWKDPNFRKKMEKYVALGFDKQEVGRAWYALESNAAKYLSQFPKEERPKRLEEMFDALMEWRKTTSTSAVELAPIFAKMGAVYPDLTPVEMRTIAKRGVDLAAVKSIPEFAGEAPGMLVAGRFGKVDPRTAVFLGAYSTAITGSPAEAKTGMSRAALQLQMVTGKQEETLRRMAEKMGVRFGEGELELNKKTLRTKAGILASAGIKIGEDDLYQEILKLGERHKKQPVTAGELQALVGVRGAKWLLPMIEAAARGDLQRKYAEFMASVQPGEDIVGRQLEQVRRTDPYFAAAEAAQKAKAGEEAARRGGRGPLYYETVDAERERMRIKSGGGWWSRQTAKWSNWNRFLTTNTDEETAKFQLANEYKTYYGLDQQTADRLAEIKLGLRQGAPEELEGLLGRGGKLTEEDELGPELRRKLHDAQQWGGETTMVEIRDELRLVNQNLQGVLKVQPTNAAPAGPSAHSRPGAR